MTISAGATPGTPCCEMRHQPDRQRRADHRAAAIAHDRKARRHAAPVGEPFDQRGDRRDVAQSLADAADEAAAQIDEPELMDRQRRAAEQHEAAAPASAAMSPALRGPACSSQPPQIAAEMPSMAMKISKMWVTSARSSCTLS